LGLGSGRTGKQNYLLDVAQIAKQCTNNLQQEKRSIAQTE
jgi:hypothetical protein